MVTTHRALLRLHVEAVWGVRLPPIEQNDVSLLPEGHQPSWKLCAAAMAGGHVHIWRPDASSAEREALLKRAHEALNSPLTVVAAAGISREVAFHQVEPPALEIETARQMARLLTSRDRPLLRTFQPNSEDYYLHPDRRPLIGVVTEGRLLSLAHSSRRTSEACELGIITLPAARRRGYALAATTLWAATVSQEGLVPIYSALVKNTASLNLASASGYRVFAHIATVK
jgi:RimJ/RimL family protein N-acetyltransferase